MSRVHRLTLLFDTLSRSAMTRTARLSSRRSRLASSPLDQLHERMFAFGSDGENYTLRLSGPHGVAVSTRGFHPRSGSSTLPGGIAPMGRLGLEPRTTGLTCRTGFHRPPAPRRRRCGLDHLFTLGRTGRVGGVWPLRALPPMRGCLLIAQSPEVFTAMGTPGLSGGPSK